MMRQLFIVVLASTAQIAPASSSPSLHKRMEAIKSGVIAASHGADVAGHGAGLAHETEEATKLTTSIAESSHSIGPTSASDISSRTHLAPIQHPPPAHEAQPVHEVPPTHEEPPPHQADPAHEEPLPHQADPVHESQPPHEVQPAHEVKPAHELEASHFPKPPLKPPPKPGFVARLISFVRRLFFKKPRGPPPASSAVSTLGDRLLPFSDEKSSQIFSKIVADLAGPKGAQYLTKETFQEMRAADQPEKFLTKIFRERLIQAGDFLHEISPAQREADAKLAKLRTDLAKYINLPSKSPLQKFEAFTQKIARYKIKKLQTDQADLVKSVSPKGTKAYLSHFLTLFGPAELLIPAGENVERVAQEWGMPSKDLQELIDVAPAARKAISELLNSADEAKAGSRIDIEPTEHVHKVALDLVHERLMAHFTTPEHVEEAMGKIRNSERSQALWLDAARPKNEFGEQLQLNEPLGYGRSGDNVAFSKLPWSKKYGLFPSTAATRQVNLAKDVALENVRTLYQHSVRAREIQQSLDQVFTPEAWSYFDKVSHQIKRQA
ncbi:hypothetical protein O181_065952 [Austropuccinia psidii MF-1]|uniref:Uncharacterized protein n=1 Tax=Austropuccinia psidii MF-1 TaxID=1389203 RepID=A0A9Q3EUG5_9BASI|nr:hypothetical protein [Austropuccinia psidii MF-1]